MASERWNEAVERLKEKHSKLELLLDQEAAAIFIAETAATRMVEARKFYIYIQIYKQENRILVDDIGCVRKNLELTLLEQLFKESGFEITKKEESEEKNTYLLRMVFSNSSK